MSTFSHFKNFYRSGKDDLAQDFFLPCLNVARQYDRASGFFSSKVLLEWITVLPRFRKSEELLVRLIIAPELSSVDREALERAVNEQSRLEYCQKIADSMIIEATGSAVGSQSSHFASELLTWMVAKNYLILKFAFPNHVSSPGIFHEKIGLFHLPESEIVAFSGSANETGAGYRNNYESIDVYRSWVSEDVDRVRVKQAQFEEAWANAATGLTVLELSSEVLSRVRIRAPADRPREERKEFGECSREVNWHHQDEAIEKFLASKRGILEMATGTGKTRTALRIFRELAGNDKIISCVIAADGNDLLHQWSIELYKLFVADFLDWRVFKNFGAHRESERYWLNPTKALLIVSREFLPAVLQKISSDVKTSTLLIHDEVHRLGSTSNRINLNELSNDIIYRLGLSATPERTYDEEGTDFIKKHIGDVIFEFTLKDAIENGILAPFRYFPLKFVLSDEDRAKIRRIYAKYEQKRKLGERFDIADKYIEIAGVTKLCENKLPVFDTFIHENTHLLRRCIIFVETREYGDKVLEILHKYTSNFHTYYGGEDSEVLRNFAGGDLECLITCHRLSEGIDIRDIGCVILFASSKSRLETIQRIGRCLRTDPENRNKVSSVVDFIKMEDQQEEIEGADLEREIWLSDIASTSKLEREYGREERG